MAFDQLKREIRLHRDHAHLCASVAAALERRITESISVRGSCAMALAGGQTPLPLFDLLAGEYEGRIPWDKVHLFWGDERWVSDEDPESNYGQARRHLIEHIPIPASNVHPMIAGQSDSEDAAADYEILLRSLLGVPPVIDILLLGMGSDGHIASIFPDSNSLLDSRRLVVPATAPQPPRKRITVTLDVINQARHIYFLIVGSGKSEALKCAFGQLNTIDPCPARFVEPVDGNVVWWVDAEAAEGL